MLRFFHILTFTIFSIALLLGAPAVQAKSMPANERIEVAFVLDTTGSMARLIEGAKRKIWSIANTIIDINPDADIHMALIGYRDFGDDYVIRKYDMSRDVQGLYGNLLKFRAKGGGDNPEAVNEALNEAVNRLEWSRNQNVRKIIFLVGDAPPHMDYNGPQYPEILKEADRAGIIVNAVQAGNSRRTRQIWQKIALDGGGDYIAIPQDGGTVVVIETPFDDEIIILQKQIDETVIPYGSMKRQSAVRSKMRTKAMAPSAVRVENSKFYSKRKYAREVITGGGDLIGDIRNGLVSLDKIKKQQLPKPLQSASPAKRAAYVKARINARKKLEKKMSALVRQRDEYVIARKKADTGATRKDSFDKAVTRSLKKQLR